MPGAAALALTGSVKITESLITPELMMTLTASMSNLVEVNRHFLRVAANATQALPTGFITQVNIRALVMRITTTAGAARSARIRLTDDAAGTHTLDGSFFCLLQAETSPTRTFTAITLLTKNDATLTDVEYIVGG